jgi:hypothetical protein
MTTTIELVNNITKLFVELYQKSPEHCLTLLNLLDQEFDVMENDKIENSSSYCESSCESSCE